MMNDDRPLVTTRGVTDSAAITIALQDRLAESAEILIVLPFQRVAGGAKANEVCRLAVNVMSCFW